MCNPTLCVIYVGLTKINRKRPGLTHFVKNKEKKCSSSQNDASKVSTWSLMPALSMTPVWTSHRYLKVTSWEWVPYDRIWTSNTQFWPNFWQNWQFFDCLFAIFATNFGKIVIFCANFNCFEWPRIEKQSNHLITPIRTQDLKLMLWTFFGGNLENIDFPQLKQQD